MNGNTALSSRKMTAGLKSKEQRLKNGRFMNLTTLPGGLQQSKFNKNAPNKYLTFWGHLLPGDPFLQRYLTFTRS